MLFLSSRLVFVLAFFGSFATCSAFVSPPGRHDMPSLHLRRPFLVPSSDSPVSSRTPVNPWSLHAEKKTGIEAIEELSEERRQNLFQALLRDLQVEEVPLLGCDADQVHTMQAALWTTMAELSDQDKEQRACLIMESIPMEALKSFVDDFTILKTQNRLTEYMPELTRISVSLVGKGIGPAILIETSTRTDEEVAEKKKRTAALDKLNERKCSAAMKAFVQRVVIGYQTCPYTKDVNVATFGPIGYRFSPAADACGALAAFWNAICELQATPDNVLSTTILSIPAIAPGRSREAHSRFAAVSELISRSLCLFRGDDVYSLVHFHPAYERKRIDPISKPAYGQLPPQSWLPYMLRKNGNEAQADTFTERDYFCSNYQRRAPHMAINILRVKQLEDASGPQSIVDLDVGKGVIEKASGIATYSNNAIELAYVGKDELDAALEVEIAMQY